MNIQKFLVATSILAMTATNASALDVVLGSSTAATPVAGSDFAYPLADELCLEDGGSVSGVVAFTISLTNGGTFPQDIEAVVTLPANVTFEGMAGVPGSAVSTDGSSGGAPTSGSRTAGGNEGDSTVTFTISEAQGSASNIGFVLPVTVEGGCPDGSGINIVLTDSVQGGFVEGDPFVNTNEAVMAPALSILSGCAPAITTEIEADGLEKEIALLPAPAYTTIGDNLLGTVTHTLNHVLLDANTLVAVTDIVDVDTRVRVEDETGLLNAVVGGTADGFGATSSSDQVALISRPFADGVTENIYVNEDPANAADPTDVVTIANQSVTATTTVNFTAASGLESKEDATGNLDPLNREGAVFGTFDWVGASNGGGTNTVLRVTGLPKDVDIPYTVTLTNTNDYEFNGVYSGTIAAADSDGEVVLQSFNLFGVDNPVDFVRADAEICFETDATTVDVDRLLARGGIISAFNDGSNNSAAAGTPNTDDDDATSE